MAERFGQPPGITQGDIGARYTRKRLGDEVYIGHYIKAGDRIRVRSTILTGVIASLTTVNLTIGGRVQGLDGDLVPFGDSFTFTADGVQTAQYVMAPEGYVVDLIVQSTSTGLVSGDLTVIVDIVQGIGSNAVAVGLLAFGYIYPAGLLGLNVPRNIGGGSGGGMAIGGTVTSGTTPDILFVGSGPVLAQDANLTWDATNKQINIVGIPCATIWQKTVSLTNAQIKALPTTPVNLLAAPGVGKRYLFFGAIMDIDATAGAYTNFNVVTSLLTLGTAGRANGWGVYDEKAQGAFGDASAVHPVWIPAVADIGSGNSSLSASWQFDAGDLANAPLAASWNNSVSGNLTGGNAANSLTFTLFYLLQ